MNTPTTVSATGVRIAEVLAALPMTPAVQFEALLCLEAFRHVALLIARSPEDEPTRRAGIESARGVLLDELTLLAGRAEGGAK